MQDANFGSSEAASLGGKARADSLTNEQRSESARRAAEARWAKEGKLKPIPRATHEGVIRIKSGETDLEIDCAVLENGQRLLTQSGFMRALGRARQAKGRQYYDGDVNMPAFLTAKNLKEFIPKELEVTSSQIEFKPMRGARAFGYAAELLPKVCDVFLDAETAEHKEKKKILTHNQRPIAKMAHVLIRGLAHVGIIALVDEATGFQDTRARDALVKILEAFVAKELQPYIKLFPVDYFKELYRLRGLSWPPKGNKMPRYFGRITNDIVYSRLAPGLLQTFDEKNPTNERGYRRNKNTQYLTDKIGKPKLLEHLAIATAFMQASADGDYQGFHALLNKARPKQQDIEAPLFDGLKNNYGEKQEEAIEHEVAESTN